MSIVKAKLQAKKAEFISIDDVLELLCKEGEGCSIEEAAQYLCELLAVHGKEIKYLWDSLMEGICGANRRTFVADIEKMARGHVIDPWDSNTHENGFDRAEILAVLANEGLNLGEATSPKKDVPVWALYCRAIRRYNLIQAARILVGTDPMDCTWLGDDWQREIDRACMALSQAIGDGDIVPYAYGTDEEPTICNASDLRDWAYVNGYEWPIPETHTSARSVAALSGSAHVVRDEILTRLQDSERARNELLAEVDRLKAEGKRASDQSAALAEQAVQIGKLQADFASAQDEIRKLKDEIGQGKSLSTWQKLVIGMAVERYGYQPNAARSTTAADISAALGSARIEVTAETVRSCLRTAADLHLRSAGRRQA